ncbi:MAG: hypothetical protein FWD60_11840 [Candidatus Azobacteroides sp.]|nr:hypothetical protein [Candidatus Azobacteroides sp.]
MAQEKTNTILSCCDKIMKAFGRKNFDEVVHKLIYPALLGSMIYDMFKFDSFNSRWFYKSGIVLFYLLDYYHVFTFLRKKFKQQKRNTECIGIDFLVSVFLTLAYHLNCPIFLCLIPLLFARYASILITEKLYNKIPIWRLHIVFMLITIVLTICVCCCSLNEVWLIYSMIFLYVLLMLIEICHTPNEFIELQSDSASGQQPEKLKVS